MPTAKTSTPKPPKIQRYTFTAQCLTKDNQVAVCTPLIKYQSDVKLDEWFYARVKMNVERMVDNYAGERDLYDVTTDRNVPKDLLKKLTEKIKDLAKGETKPPTKIKIEEVTLIIKRDR